MEMTEEEIRASIRLALADSLRKSMIVGVDWKDVPDRWKSIAADELTKIINHLETRGST